MGEKNKFLKTLPIEIYSLFAPTMIILVFFSIWDFFSKKINLYTCLKGLPGLVLTGETKLSVAFIFFWMVIVFLILICIIKNRGRDLDKNIMPAVKTLFAVNAMAVFLSLSLGLSLMLLTRLVEINKVINATLLLDKAEKIIFGNIPAFHLIKILGDTVLEQLILYSYSYLFLFFPIALIIIVFTNKHTFRIVINAFFLSFIIALPIYFVLPAVSPDSLYIAKIFNSFLRLTTPDYNFSDMYKAFNEVFHLMWISKSNDFFSVSSMPSLHAAWGIIAAAGVIKVNRLMGYFFVIWFLLNTIGTFYSLQHYALDAAAGLILGAITLIMAEKLTKFEKKYYTGRDWYYFSSYLIEIKNKIKFTINNLI